MNTPRCKTLLVVCLMSLCGCASEDYANGERIGLVTQFSRAGIFWKSWEGHLNLTQTGMNSSSAEPFDFSIDNDKEDPHVIAMIDSAANLGWKVKLLYHETYNKNWFRNRGETDHFITSVEVLDRTVSGVHTASQPSAERVTFAARQNVTLSCEVIPTAQAAIRVSP